MLRQNQDEIRVVCSQQDTRWSLRHWGGSANWISGIGGVGTQVGKASTGFASVAQNNGRPQVCSAPSLAGGKSKQWWVETEFVCALRHFFTQAPLVPSSVQAMDL